MLWLSACQPGKTRSEQPEARESTSVSVSSDSLQKVVLLPYWVTTAQFAGYYVGKEKGIFRRHGIDLEIITFQPTMDMADLITHRKADFFLLWLVNAIDMKDAGIDLVNIAQLSSRSSLMLLTKKSSGIFSISDMEGKKAGIWSGYEMQPQALFKKFGVNVEIIPIGSTNNLFLMDGVQITNANWFDEYHAILNSGYDENELVTFFFADYGLNFLEDGIYCLKEMNDQHPDLCNRFVDAALESWVYAFEHPAEALDIVLNEQRKAKIPANFSHQQWMLNRYKDLYYPREASSINTVLKESDYLTIAAILKEASLIQAIPPFREFYIPCPVQKKSNKQAADQ